MAKRRQDYTAASIYTSPNTSQLAEINTAAADRIIFYDQSADIITQLSLGTGLSISGTTLNNTGAPSDADYLVKTANASLSAERVVTDTTSITVDWATAGQAKFQREALTGDVTASQNSNTTAIDKTAITGKTTVTAAADDLILISDTSDSGNLKKITAPASGTYTPTLTNVTNVASTTAFSCQYMQVGTIVTVSGQANVTPTAAAPTTTQLGISLPVASKFTAFSQCAGVGQGIDAAYTAGPILADATNDTALLQYDATTLFEVSFYFTFTYRIV